jgi:hypothetical protein
MSRRPVCRDSCPPAIVPRMEKPLFVPLKREWFEAFASGAKQEEWRRYGRGWNEQTCRIGRPVTLSLGYSGARLHGRVTSFRVAPASPGAAELYGEGTPCAVIGVEIAPE